MKNEGSPEESGLMRHRARRWGTGGLLLLSFFTWMIRAVAQVPDVASLLAAAGGGHVATVQLLLERGAPVNGKDVSGRTALHLAAANGHQASAEALIRAGGDLDASDKFGKTPLDLALQGGHSGLAQFLESKGANRTRVLAMASARALKPSLKFKTLESFAAEIGEPAALLDSTNICFFVPKRREQEAGIIFGYLVKAYEALYEIVGTHSVYKMAVYAFPKGNPHGWGGTSECSIEYDDTNLDLARQREWTQYEVPHVSGFIEEMAHNFVSATQAQFGWEMIGWSLGADVSGKVAGNPILTEELRTTRTGQEWAFEEYARNGYVFPRDLPANQCDRIHAWILHRAALKYGPRFWPDFFREVRSRKQAFINAGRLGDGDRIRNARYQITLGCFDALRGLNFKGTLAASGISLVTDVKSLHPEAPGWNRRLTE